MTDNVNHPAHYGGEDNPYEAIKVIEEWGLGFAWVTQLNTYRAGWEERPEQRDRGLGKGCVVFTPRNRAFKARERKSRTKWDKMGQGWTKWDKDGQNDQR